MSFFCFCLNRLKIVWLSFICHTAGRLRPESEAQLNSLWRQYCPFSSLTAGVLIHPVEALCILDGDVEFLPQLFKRLIRRQVQPIETLGGESKDNHHIKIMQFGHSQFLGDTPGLILLPKKDFPQID